MANVVQKTIYNLSAVTPICFIFSIVWILQKKSFVVPIVVSSIAIFLIIAFGVSFSYGRKRMAPINIRVTDVSEHDAWIVGYIISYMLPFASMIIEEWGLISSTIVAIVLGLIAPYVNSATPNILLVFRKYHFYKIRTETGIDGYVLISKNKIRNKKDVQVVNRMFEFLLIDKGGC